MQKSKVQQTKKVQAEVQKKQNTKKASPSKKTSASDTTSASNVKKNNTKKPVSASARPELVFTYDGMKRLETIDWDLNKQAKDALVIDGKTTRPVSDVEKASKLFTLKE